MVLQHNDDATYFSIAHGQDDILLLAGAGKLKHGQMDGSLMALIRTKDLDLIFLSS